MSRSALYRCGCVQNRDGEGLYVSLIPCRNHGRRLQAQLGLLAAAMALARQRDKANEPLPPDADPIPLSRKRGPC